MSSEVSENQGISRRDFLKLKTFMMVWFYFLQSFGINLFADESLKKCDYSLLDKLMNLPFSEMVKNELELRVALQKRYCYDANGNLHSLDRFLKEMINFIVSQENFKDFKILTSVKDQQINLSYMFNATAKHNQLQSMNYLQKKLLAHKDNAMLVDALTYAVKSRSYDTTVHLMKQKIKLDDTTQKHLLKTLQQEEYDIFCKKLNGSNQKLLLTSNKTSIKNRRYITKKDVRFFLEYGYGSQVQDQLYSVVYNSVAELYIRYILDDFEVRVEKEKIYIQTWAKIYPIDFFRLFEEVLKSNGYENIYENHQMLELRDFLKFREQNEKSNQYAYGIDEYDFINIEIL